MCGYPTQPLTTIADVTRVYGRVPTKNEIIANRQCWDYFYRKRREGTLVNFPAIHQNNGTAVNGITQSWAPDQRSLYDIWTEARVSFPNANATPASAFDNPEISPDILS
jgi:hypothetical protein